MSRAIVLAGALVLTPIIAAAVASNSGALDWLSGDTASAALFANDVRLGPPAADPNEDAEVELGVTGAAIDCAPTGAGPEDSESIYQLQGANFWVRGTLSSFDGATAVVAGPSGDVTATLADEFNLIGDLSPGSAVEMTGTGAEDGSMTARELRSVCAGAGVIDCATEEDPHFQLRIEGTTFEVTGRLESLTSDKISVMGPGLVVEISRDGATQIEGGLEAGDPVRVEGTVLDAQQLKALAVALQCEGLLSATPAPVAPAADGADDEDADDGDDDEDEDGKDNEKCNPGEAQGRGALRLKVLNGGKVIIRRAAVLSQDSGSLTVDTPSGPLTVLLDEDTDTDGDLASALAVWITGEMQEDGSVLAEDVKVLCSDGDGDEDEREEDGDEDDDDDEEEDDDEDDDEGNEDEDEEGKDD